MVSQQEETMSTQTKRPDWQTESIFLTVLYLLIECRQQLPVVSDSTTDIGFLEKELGDMHARGLIKIDGQYWKATNENDRGVNGTRVGAANGTAFLGQAVAMCDQLMKFEIFGGVRLQRMLTPDERLDDDEFMVRDHIWDPRFVGPKEEDPDATDLRVGMIRFFSEMMMDQIGGVVDPHRIVFLQKLASGQLKGESFWFNLRLGTFFKEVETIVNTAYQWRQIAPDDEAQAIEVMKILYAAGMIESRKRAPDASECSNCHIPLALFEAEAHGNGQRLSECPNPDCGASFDPPAPQGAAEACACCHEDIWPGMRQCTNCGAIVDRRYTPGKVVETERVTQTTTVDSVYDPYYDTWGYGYGYYGYTPYGYYDPWNPVADVVAFGVLCAILL